MDIYKYKGGGVNFMICQGCSVYKSSYDRHPT